MSQQQLYWRERAVSLITTPSLARSWHSSSCSYTHTHTQQKSVCFSLSSCRVYWSAFSLKRLIRALGLNAEEIRPHNKSNCVYCLYEDWLDWNESYIMLQNNCPEVYQDGRQVVRVGSKTNWLKPRCLKSWNHKTKYGSTLLSLILSVSQKFELCMLKFQLKNSKFWVKYLKDFITITYQFKFHVHFFSALEKSFHT